MSELVTIEMSSSEKLRSESAAGTETETETETDTERDTDRYTAGDDKDGGSSFSSGRSSANPMHFSA